MIGLKKKSKKHGAKCRPRQVCLRPKLDETVMKFCEENDECFSNWAAKILKQHLIEKGYYPS